jgi:hypothetical protein
MVKINIKASTLKRLRKVKKGYGEPNNENLKTISDTIDFILNCWDG